MHTCTDACTHCNQGVGAERGSLAHANEVTQGHIYLYRTMQGGGAHVHSQVDMHKCTDEYTHTYTTHSNQGLGLQRGRMGTHIQGQIAANSFCMQVCKGMDHMWEVRWPCINVPMHVHILIVLYPACV